MTNLEKQPAIDRLIEMVNMVDAMYPDLTLRTKVEMALDAAVMVLVDGLGTAEDTPLERALTDWLMHTRPPSGAFGQSMENTMAYESTRTLRSAAAKHLTAR